ncbi:MAG: hypothetical protein PHO03_05535 [Candidatus Omnitrophica bacterium]|nr:hypothetical protein [Candidatus Omnitrophota bacterium]
MMQNKKLQFFAAVSFLLLGIALNPAYGDDPLTLSVFHSPTCQRCLKVKKEVISEIEKEFKGKIRIEYHDIADIKNYTSMLGLKEKHNKNITLELPVFFINGNLLNGTGDVKGNLERLISASLAGPKQEGAIPGVDLVSRFKDIRPLAIFGAGLTDGINPCAFTVIVFFMSYLAFQGYRKLELLIIGLSFIFAVFLTYFLIGLGIFNFLYRLEGFWALTKIFNISIGIFSLILGILAVYDLLKFSQTRDTEGQLLQLPKVIKNRIHSVIGRHYRKAKEAQGEQKRLALNLARLVLSALVTGFLVSILEAVCTGQLYLPTLTFILKTTPLKVKALVYLVIYNIMFIIPLLIVFLLALLGVTSSAFAQFIRKHMVTVKALMAVLFISLGIFLVWRG